MSDDKGGAEWVDNVLVVWVEHEAIDYFACKTVSYPSGLTLEADDSLKLEVLFGNLFHFSLQIVFNLVEVLSNLGDCDGSLDVKGLTLWWQLVCFDCSVLRKIILLKRLDADALMGE